MSVHVPRIGERRTQGPYSYRGMIVSPTCARIRLQLLHSLLSSLVHNSSGTRPATCPATRPPPGRIGSILSGLPELVRFCKVLYNGSFKRLHKRPYKRCFYCCFYIASTFLLHCFHALFARKLRRIHLLSSLGSLNFEASPSQIPATIRGNCISPFGEMGLHPH